MGTETNWRNCMYDVKVQAENNVERVLKGGVLKEYFPKGSTAYTTVTKVAPSGMSRHIKIMVAVNSNWIANLSHDVAKLLDMKYKDNTSSIYVQGGGMDMGFHLIYNLASELYGDGYAIKHRWI
tara:strand:- start:161 stop:532 length:372 start_codon:yes stop_codon:yes gene_type:complete